MVACLVAAAMVSACAFPTEAPIIEQHWNLPAGSTTIGVATLLPSSITVSGSAFAVAVDAPAPVTRTLYQDCSACAAADGATIPKPAFTAAATSSTSLPSEIASATLTGGAISVTVQNNYAFDPIRPAAGVTGSIIIRVANGATVLGQTTVSGGTTSLPVGGSRVINVPLSGVINGAQPLAVTVEIVSPAGDPVQMTATQAVTANSSVVGVTVGSASVSVAGRSVSTTSEIDLEGIDDAVTQRVDSAAIRLSITNPFAVSGTLTVSLEAPGLAPLTRTIQLTPSSTAAQQVVKFNASEIRPFFGRTVTLRIDGPVTASGPVTVTPTQVVAVATRLDLFVAIGR